MGSQPFTLRPRQPGQPQQPEFPGAPPRPSMPAQSVNQPAAASAPPGRPPMPVPTPAGSPGPFPPPSPGSGSTAAPGAGRSVGLSAPGPTFFSTPPPGGTAGGGGGAGTPPAAPAAAPPVAPLGYRLDHVPTKAERAGMPPGLQISTPYGDIGPDGGLVQTPETAAAYQGKVLEVTKQFGWHPGTTDPMAPQPTIRLGKPHYNPFTNEWVQG